jgi:hypothetical protein
MADVYLQIMRMEEEIKEAEAWWKRNNCKTANCRSELLTKVNMMEFRLEQLLKRKVEVKKQKLALLGLVQKMMEEGFFQFREIEEYLKR